MCEEDYICETTPHPVQSDEFTGFSLSAVMQEHSELVTIATVGPPPTQHVRPKREIKKKGIQNPIV